MFKKKSFLVLSITSLHFTSRGNARNEIFVEDGDREAFLATLAWVVGRFGWVCHAYCLMDNHFHLLIETPEPNLSSGMRQLNGVYTQRFNRYHPSVLVICFRGTLKRYWLSETVVCWSYAAISCSTPFVQGWLHLWINISGAVTLQRLVRQRYQPD